MLRRAVYILGVIAASISLAWGQIDCAPPAPGPCALLRGWKAVFVGTVIKQSPGTCRFRIAERLKGAKGVYIDLEDPPLWGYGSFQVGQSYLVFAEATHVSGGKPLFAPKCGPTRRLQSAQAILDQLRREKRGQRVASVYGTLFRTLEPEAAIWDETYVRPLPDVTVRLQSGKKSYETRTNERGAYFFERIPAGTYQASADLPTNLEVAQQLHKGAVPPFELPRQSCYEYDLTALPTGRITGSVTGPDAKPLRQTSVDLYRVGQYREGQAGLCAYQGEGKPFEFAHLPAGDYIIVFNNLNRANPDAPFPRTFYPGVAHLGSSQTIRLADGQQISHADIHVSGGLPTRRIAVRLTWGERKQSEYYPPTIIVSASQGTQPYPYKTSDLSYTLNLLLTARYTIHGEAYCRAGTKEKTETSAVTVDGSDPSVSDVTLVFDKGQCPPH